MGRCSSNGKLVYNNEYGENTLGRCLIEATDPQRL